MTYIGKDVIHYGCGLHFDPDRVWGEIGRAARKNVRKAERAGFRVERAEGSPSQLAQLRELWYLPADPNFPTQLASDDILYLAHLDGQLAGGVILIPVGAHLFLNNLTASEIGKQHQLQGYLLWRLVEELKDSVYSYLDVGVSYRPNLYRFFDKWSTFKYPVIFYPPPVTPSIRLAPFTTVVLPQSAEGTEPDLRTFCHDRPYTVVPDVSYAVSILQSLGMNFERTPYPLAGDDSIQVVDLTEWIPVPYGSIIVGLELSPQQLWDDYGCYDFVKTGYLVALLNEASNSPEAILLARKRIHMEYRKRFEIEDVTILDPGAGVDRFIIQTADASKLSERYQTFGVESTVVDQALSLPCHQNLTTDDVEYVYAIYRGFLNLCSEWVPTNVKGRMTSDAGTIGTSFLKR